MRGLLAKSKPTTEQVTPVKKMTRLNNRTDAETKPVRGEHHTKNNE